MPVAVTNANIIEFFVTDPLSVGFADIRTANPGASQPLIDASVNTSGPGAGTVAADPIAKSDLYGLINPTNLVAMNSQQIGLWGMIPDTVKIGESGTQANLEAMFDGFSATLASFAAAYTRPAGPWEVYFGKGNLPSISIIDDARNSPPGDNF